MTSEHLSKPELYSKWIRKLRERSDSGVTIVVEGVRDEEKLRELGVSGPILKIQGERVLEWIETLPKQIIVMTDFDPQGAKYASQLKIHGEHNGIKVNTQIRVKIFSNSFAKTVEDLSFPENPADKPLE